MTNIYHFKTKPWGHQVKALRKLLSEPAKEVGGNAFMDMGTGKTKVAIDYAGILQQYGLIDQVLIVCPIDALGVWNLEVLKHSGNPAITWRSVNFDQTYRYTVTKRDELDQVLSITEVDHFSALAEYCNEAPTLLIVDEADEIANPMTKRSKHVNILAQLCVRVLNMTGTPIRKYPLDMFAYCRMIDEGILGGSWQYFKKQYAQWGGYAGTKVIHYQNQQQLFKRIEPYTYSCKLEDVLDMPKRMEPEIIPVHLNESREIYERYAAESIVTIEGMDYEAPIILTLLLRLRQLTGGWLHGGVRKRRVGREKEKAFESKLKQMYRGDVEKIVVYANYLDDMRVCAQVAKKAGYHVIPFWGGLQRDQRERFIAHFEERKGPTLWLSHSRAGTRSIPLTAAHHTLYYSMTRRFVQMEQSMRRTWRPPQKYPCYYGVFIAEDTIDEAVWLSYKTKQSLAALVYKKPELII